MRMLEFFKDGNVKVEKVTKSFDFYEIGEGIYSIPHDAVYRDRNGKRPPIAILMDGIFSAIGADQTKERVNRVWLNMDITKDMNHKASISTSFGRWLGELLGKLAKYAPIIIVIGILVYALLMQMGQPVVSTP